MKTQRVLLVVALLVCLCLPSVSAADKIGALGRVGEGAESYILHFVLPAGSTISGTTATWAAADSNETLITRLSAAEKANAATPVSGTTGTFTGTFTLDDGTGASPDFIMQDATNETATFSKVDAGYLTITTVAGDGVQITTGNLRVGNGSNGQTLDGEDAYVEGLLEVDGMIYADGGVTGTLTGTATGLAGTPNITVGTINAGAGGMTVDADGDVTALTYTATRADSEGAIDLYERTSAGDGKVTITADIITDNATHTITFGNQSLNFSDGTFTDGKYCTYASSGDMIACNSTPAGVGDFLADGTVPMTGDLTITSATPDIVLNDSDDAAGTASIKANSSGGANDIVLTIGVEDSTGAGTSYIEVDGVSETVDLLKPVAIDAAGVKFTGSNGSITILGLGDGTDEDLTINLNSNNVATISSSTSVDKISISALNFASTGWIQGGIKVDSDANGEDNATMAAAGLYGTLFLATGAGTWTLPTAVLGMSMCLMNTGAAADLILDVQSTDTMTLKGTEDSAGDGITNATGSSTGDFVCVVAIAANKWATMGMQGTWTAQ